MIEIKCIETGEIFRSVKHASKELNISATSIYQAVNKKCAANGLHFIPFLNNEVGEKLTSQLLSELNQKKDRRLIKEQRLREIKQSRQARKAKQDDIIVDLFKSWWNNECTIEECARESGYSVAYIYQRFKIEREMRGLSLKERRDSNAICL